jgi:hypothetical protein
MVETVGAISPRPAQRSFSALAASTGLEALADEMGLDNEAVVKTDVTDRKQVKALVDRAVELHGRRALQHPHGRHHAGRGRHRTPQLVPGRGRRGGNRRSDEKNAISADSFVRCVLFAMGQPEDVDNDDGSTNRG